MIIITEKYEVKKGAFADVFICKNNMIALKLFKSYNHPDLMGTGKESIGIDRTNEYRKKVFQTEIQAYINIQDSDILKKFTPNYYGHKNIEKIFENSTDISLNYLLDCCFSIEYFIGQEIKLNLLRYNERIINQLESKLSFTLDAIIEEFADKGVNYTLDSSVIWNENIFKIIDFATIDSNEFQPIIESI